MLCRLALFRARRAELTPATCNQAVFQHFCRRPLRSTQLGRNGTTVALFAGAYTKHFVGHVIDLSVSPPAIQVNAAASIIQRHVHPDANIIIGALVDERCGKQVSVTVLATGFGVSRTAMLLPKLVRAAIPLPAFRADFAAEEEASCRSLRELLLLGLDSLTVDGLSTSTSRHCHVGRGNVSYQPLSDGYSLKV